MYKLIISLYLHNKCLNNNIMNIRRLLSGITLGMFIGCINAFEFRLREADTGGYPKGLVYYMNAMDSWLYGGDPLMHIKYEHAIENVKKSLNTNHFENLIKKYAYVNEEGEIVLE